MIFGRIPAKLSLVDAADRVLLSLLRGSAASALAISYRGGNLMLHRIVLAGAVAVCTAFAFPSETRAQQDAVRAAPSDPCRTDPQSRDCRAARVSRLAETQGPAKAEQARRYVKGLPSDYVAATSGDPTMADAYAPPVETIQAGLVARQGAGPVRVAPGGAAIRVAPGQQAAGVSGASGLASSGPSFDPQVFAQNIRAALDGNATGYAYAISRNGQLAAQGANGKLRAAADGNINHSASRRQNIASVSKLITAVGVLRLLDDLGLDLDDKIAPYLPESWVLGPNVEDLTFGHLLRHRTGFQSANNDFWNTLSWDGLRTMVQTGANPGAPFNYLNANFALFRFIIPAMWKETGTNYPIYIENGTAAAFWYIFYFQSQIFDPIGVEMAQCVDPSQNSEALFYDAAASLSGVSGGDWNVICASGGWVLSANDLANFLAHAMHDDAVLSPEMRALMKDSRLGVYRTAGDHGDYFSHGGAIGWSGGQGMVMCAMTYSIDVEAAVLVNSPVSGIAGGAFCNTVLAEGFDAAWN